MSAIIGLSWERRHLACSSSRRKDAAKMATRPPSQQSFGAWQLALEPLVLRAGVAQRARQGFEQRLDLVVIGAPVRHLQVQVGAYTRSESLEEVFEQVDIKIAYALAARRSAGKRRCAEYEIGAPAQVDGGERQRLIHGHHKVAGAVDPLLRTERQAQRLAEHDAGVLNRVMLIDVEVAARLEFQVKPAVPREKLKHVVEKADAGRDRVPSAAVERQPRANVGLCRLPMQPSGARFHAKYPVGE